MGNASLDFLSVCHVNAQSLFAHLDEFRSFFEDSGYHIICVSETWLKPSISDNMVALRGYHIIRQDRTCRGGGGVALYLCNQLKGKIVQHSESLYCGKPEYLMVEVLTNACSKLLIATVYRPPHCGYLSDI